jgi:phage RecT family recombinase
MTAKSTALAPMHGGEPYSSEGQRIAPHPSQVNELALARKTKLGAMLLTEQSEFFALAKVAGFPAERLVLELVSVARKKPEIMDCTPDSIMSFMFDAAKLGVMIGRGVFPVPVNHGQGKDRVKRLEAWVGYHGAKELAMSSGAIRDCWATVVFAGDPFEMVKAPIPSVTKHTDGPNSGNMAHAIGVYATLLYPGGKTRAKYFPKAKIEEYRKKNRGDTTGGSSPWVTSPMEMWQAKAILHTVGDLPRNPRLAHLLSLVERDETPHAPAGLNPADEVQPGVAEHAEPAESEEPADAVEKVPEGMSLGEASSIPVQMQGGQTRMLGEMRNTGLEAVRTWARKGLDVDPDARPLQRIAEGCTVLLDARAAGLAKEPPKKAAA